MFMRVRIGVMPAWVAGGERLARSARQLRTRVAMTSTHLSMPIALEMVMS